MINKAIDELKESVIKTLEDNLKVFENLKKDIQDLSEEKKLYCDEIIRYIKDDLYDFRTGSALYIPYKYLLSNGIQEDDILNTFTEFISNFVDSDEYVDTVARTIKYLKYDIVDKKDTDVLKNMIIPVVDIISNLNEVIEEVFKDKISNDDLPDLYEYVANNARRQIVPLLLINGVKLDKDVFDYGSIQQSDKRTLILVVEKFLYNKNYEKQHA